MGCGNNYCWDELFRSSFGIPACLNYFFLPCVPFFYINLVLLDVALRNLSEKRVVSFNNVLKYQIVGIFLSCFPTFFLAVLSAHDHWRGGAYASSERMIGYNFLFVAMLESFLLFYYQFKKGFSSTGRLWCFWLTCVFALTPTATLTIRTLMSDWEESQNKEGISVSFRLLFLVLYASCIVNWVLQSIPSVKYDFRKKRHPERYSTFLSQLTLWWASPIFLCGYRKALNLSDIWACRFEDTAHRTSKLLLKNWNLQLQKNGFPPLAVESSSGPNSVAKPRNAVKNGGLTRGKYANGEKVKEKLVDRKQKSDERPSLSFAMFMTYFRLFIITALFKLCSDILQFTAPKIMEMILRYMNEDDPLWYGVFLALLLLVNSLAKTAFLQRYFYLGNAIGMRQRSALIHLVFRKSLVLSNESRHVSTTGQIINLMSVDAQKLMDLMTYLNLMWSAPFQIVVAMSLLYQQLGFSAFAGLAYMVCTMPINFFIGNAMKKFQVKQFVEKDNRVKLLNDILNGIKVLKLYAWEKAYAGKVTSIRDKEIQLIKKSGYLTACVSFFAICSPYMVSLCAFTAYIFSGNTLYPTTAFVSLSLFQLLKFPMTVLPTMITQLVQAKVSLKRINEFLLLEELQSDVISNFFSEKHAITLNNCTFFWDCNQQSCKHNIKRQDAAEGKISPAVELEKEELLNEADKSASCDSSRFCLNNISLLVSKGSFAAIVGFVGSGKSSILNAILGEMEKTTGEANVDGSIAYVGQQAWIQNTTLKENILFGSTYDERRYRQVIEACALKEDLKVLDSGDETEIGEKGINLSGGQKTRVSLARAVYSDRDIYLMDDPLAAVDAHVAAHIFERVIGPGGILSNKTRILVTNKLHLLHETDMIVNVENGTIKEIGSFSELFHSDSDDPLSFAQLCKAHLVQEEKEVKMSESDPSPLLKRKSISLSQRSVAEVLQEVVEKDRARNGSVLVPASIEAAKEKVTENEDKKKLLITPEVVQSGKVKSKIYIRYCKALGYIQALAAFTGLIVAQFLSFCGVLWIAKWSDETQRIIYRETNTSYTAGKRDQDLEDANFVGLVGYGINGLVFGIVVVMNAALVLIGTMRASFTLHNDMLWGVLRSPLSFFESTPLGRITNRFSKDIDIIDNSLASGMKSLVQFLLIILTIVVAISKSLPFFLLVLPPLAIIYTFIFKYYVATSRQIRRIESKWKSPLYSNFGETLQGLTDIRAYRMSDRFIKKNQELIDILARTSYANIVINRWLAIRLECIGTVIVFCTAFILVFHTVSAGNAGVAIVYALSCTQVLTCLCRTSSEVETNVVAVERIQEYCELEPEGDWKNEDGAVKEDWPTEGAMELCNLEVKYREDLKPALKDISCSIKASEKIGVAGRTGSGKSTLTLSLFRILEANKGTIKVDSVDVSQVGLHDLRSRITIIPQEPVIFVGTIRENLDLLQKYSDQQLWDALELAHLKAFATELNEKLEFQLGEGGSNISVGQRQLICLARAILRKSKILVLDEATASVDLTTDELIQNTIRTEFKDSTVVTIAHRVNAIMDCDRVLILDQGLIKEFGTPSELIEARGYFYSVLERENLLP